MEHPTVLLVHPDQRRRDQCALELFRHGCDVTPVWHPRQALEAVRCRPYDFAVLRLPLADETADTLAQKLRMQIAKLNVILIGDTSKVPCQEKSEQCQAVYLSAKVGIDGLLRVIERSTEEHNAGDSSCRQRNDIR